MACHGTGPMRSGMVLHAMVYSPKSEELSRHTGVLLEAGRMLIRGEAGGMADRSVPGYSMVAAGAPVLHGSIRENYVRHIIKAKTVESKPNLV